MRKPLRHGIAIGAVYTFVRGILGWVGDLDTARDLYFARGTIVRFLGDLALTWWLGPAIVVLCFAVHYALQWWHRRELLTPPVLNKGGDIEVAGNLRAGDDGGGDVRLEGGYGIASGGNVRIGPGQYRAGDGGPFGKGGDLNVRGGDAGTKA